MGHFNIPKQPKLSREEARELVKRSIEDCKKLHKSFRDGSWKPYYEIDIIGGKE